MARMEPPAARRMEVRNLDQHFPRIPTDHAGKSSHPPPAPRCGVCGAHSKPRGCDVPGGPGGSRLPWAGGFGRCPLTAPGAAGKLVKHPQGVGGAGKASRRQQNDPESLSGSGGPPSGMQTPGPTAAGQTLQEMTQNPPVCCAFPVIDTARAANGLTDRDSRWRGQPSEGLRSPPRPWRVHGALKELPQSWRIGG